MAVTTSTTVQIYAYQESKEITQQASLALSHIVALGLSADGQRGVALTHCDTNQDTIPDGDCAVALDLGTKPPAIRETVKLDEQAGATLLAVGRRGLTAVVADGDVLHGVDFSTSTTRHSSIPWLNANPVAIACTMAVIEGHPKNLFAIADTTSKTIRSVGFLETRLAGVSSLALDVSPSFIDFGRRSDLYIVSENKILLADLTLPQPVAVHLSHPLTQRPRAFVVQP